MLPTTSPVCSWCAIYEIEVVCGLRLFIENAPRNEVRRDQLSIEILVSVAATFIPIFKAGRDSSIKRHPCLNPNYAAVRLVARINCFRISWN
jgi:hypothetical protein